MMSNVDRGLPKMRVAVVTHARMEPFFCALWSKHYGALFGHENLFLYKDGEDWQLPRNARIGTVIPVTFPSNRKDCDDYFGAFLSAECAKLLEIYDIVLRIDVDEFLVVDPEQGNWEQVFHETTQNGYVYAMGLDIVQNIRTEGPLDLNKPILQQRRHGYVRGDYCKPCAIARPVTWTSACHTVEDGPVILSKSLKLIHLASMDRDFLEIRLTARGDFKKSSYAGHAKSRFRQFETIQSDVAYDLDAVDTIVRQRLTRNDSGDAALSPRFTQIVAPDGSVHEKSLCVRLPDRYAALIAAPDAQLPAKPVVVEPRLNLNADRLKVLRELLRPERLTIVADVGASAIEQPAYAFLLSQGACEVWGFEPQPAEFAKLVEAAGGHEHYLPYAIGDGSTKRLYLTRHPGFCSTLVPNKRVSEALQRWRKDFAIQSEIDIRTKRLDDIVELPQFDLLKIDIQGGEVSVFQNATAKLAGAIAVITETAAIPIYENQPLLSDQMQCLTALGFHLHKFGFLRSVPFRGKLSAGLSRNHLADQLTDGDAFFVRKLFDFQSQTSEMLKHLAILADFVFDSPSLAMKAVEELMDRTVVDTEGARRYAGMLIAKHTSPKMAS